MSTSPERVVARLEKKFPKIDGIQVHQGEHVFLGDCAEGGEIDGLPACNYYGWADDPNEKIWIMGVHKDLFKELESMGWHAECYDPGTYFAYRS